MNKRFWEEYNQEKTLLEAKKTNELSAESNKGQLEWNKISKEGNVIAWLALLVAVVSICFSFRANKIAEEANAIATSGNNFDESQDIKNQNQKIGEFIDKITELFPKAPDISFFNVWDDKKINLINKLDWFGRSYCTKNISLEEIKKHTFIEQLCKKNSIAQGYSRFSTSTDFASLCSNIVNNSPYKIKKDKTTCNQ